MRSLRSGNGSTSASPAARSITRKRETGIMKTKIESADGPPAELVALHNFTKAASKLGLTPFEVREMLRATALEYERQWFDQNES